jgi:hypothetical protein
MITYRIYDDQYNIIRKKITKTVAAVTHLFNDKDKDKDKEKDKHDHSNHHRNQSKDSISYTTGESTDDEEEDPFWDVNDDDTLEWVIDILVNISS